MCAPPPQAESLKGSRGPDSWEYKDKLEKLAGKERDFDRVSQSIDRMFVMLEAKRYGILSDALSSFVASQVPPTRRTHARTLAGAPTRCSGAATARERA